MAELTVGHTRIAYSVRRSSRAKHRRIEVTPDGVVLVIPKGGNTKDVHRFMESRRRWVFEQVVAVSAKAAHRDAYRPERLVTGAKVYYRGRRMRLTVKKAKGIRVEYRNGFILHAPKGTTEQVKRRALRSWLQQRVKDDVEAIVRRYARRLEVAPKGLRIKRLKEMWGSCGKGGILHFDWRLIFAPKPVLEYAVLHEVCHLKERSHGKAFWSALRAQMPDYESRKIWLDDHQHLLDALPV